MTKDELLEIIAALPDSLPPATWQRIADAARVNEPPSALAEDAAAAAISDIAEWNEGAPREEEADEPDRWLEERR